MYSIGGHGQMIADRVRTTAYTRALQQAIKPGAVVLDIGTGSGIFAVLACQAGASRVYAVEPSDVILLARKIASENGCAERIEFIQGVSTQITLPQRADVIVSDLRGILPLFQHHLPAIIDARRRFLAPSGTLIPQCDIVRAAVVEAPDIYDSYVSPWNGSWLGVRAQSGQHVTTNMWRQARCRREQLLAEPQTWTVLDYRAVEEHNVAAELSWTVARPGTGHGLAVWFDSVLMQGVDFSNAPGAPELIYGNAFFPWSTPVPLAVGDAVSVTLHADLVGDEYIWRWNTRIMSPEQEDIVKAQFNQSTFYGAPRSPATLRKRASNYIPVVSEDGEIDRLILDLMDGSGSLDDIAREIAGRFPVRFTHWQAALTRVGELSQKYSR